MNLSRRRFLQRSIAAGVAACQPRMLGAVAPATRSRPNILMIVADDLGYGDVGCYGNADIRTPCIDQLARAGVRLTQHYAGAPLCAPARAALLTGRYAHRVGAISVESNRGLDRISLGDATIADHFRAAGYATGFIGKWHNGLYDRRYLPGHRGFQEVVGFYNGGMGYNEWVLDHKGSTRRSDGRYLTDVFADEAVKFVERHRREPFFLYLPFNAPHLPHEVPDADLAPYLEGEKLNRGISTVYGMITRMDRGIGRILETLAALSLEENTLVLFTSDNGIEPGSREASKRFNGPLRGRKQDVLEGGIRVPAVIRWPDGLPRGAEPDRLVHFMDWLPTLLTAARAKRAGGKPLDGVDQLAALGGDAAAESPVRFWQYNRYTPVARCNAAMREGDWKLHFPRIDAAMKKLAGDGAPYQELFHREHYEMPVDRSAVPRQLPPPAAPELYNLRLDPGERNNLAAQEPARVSSMSAQLDAWFTAVESERRQLPEYAGHGV
ncbi:MAG: sulfatase-like hydrolase/transferase [Opitutaceae bacterium]